MSRYNHEQAKILAWEALEKSKADSKLKKMQVSYKSLPPYLEMENYLPAAGVPTLLMTHVSFTGDDQSMHWLFCTMEWWSPCPLCWVRLHTSLLGQARWPNPTQWARVRPLQLRSGITNSTIFKRFMLSRHFGCFYECMIITRRLIYHIICSRKWQSLLRQTLMFLLEL